MTNDEKRIWAAVFAASQVEIARNTGRMTRWNLAIDASIEANHTIRVLRVVRKSIVADLDIGDQQE